MQLSLATFKFNILHYTFLFPAPIGAFYFLLTFFSRYAKMDLCDLGDIIITLLTLLVKRFW
jgi:hypothetical protein